MENNTRCGYAAVIGLPNAGKSTLVNALVGSKVSIVSSKVQTTRSRVLGIKMHNDTQIILIDTPGIFAPRKTLERAMVNAAFSSFEDGDILLHIVDVTQKNALAANAEIMEAARRHKHVALILNKIDGFPKPELLSIAQKFSDSFPYGAIFMVSALKQEGIDAITGYLSKNFPEGPYLYPEDQISDMPLRMMAAEITREKIFKELYRELPYAIFVETENWEEYDNGSVKIDQVVYVQRDSQKGIVLGKGGSQIKEIGQKARLELEEIFERKVHLKIFVKLQEDWAEREENYRIMGLEKPV
jgi:GTP-binding protein Era